STNGIQWESFLMPGDAAGLLGFGNGQFLHLKGNDSASTSGDGRTWTEHPLNGLQLFPVSAFVYGQGAFILVGHPPRGAADGGRAELFSSPDGLSWSRRLGGETVFAMVAGGNGGVALATSADDGALVVRRSDTGVE